MWYWHHLLHHTIWDEPKLIFYRYQWRRFIYVGRHIRKVLRRLKDRIPTHGSLHIFSRLRQRGIIRVHDRMNRHSRIGVATTYLSYKIQEVGSWYDVAYRCVSCETHRQLDIAAKILRKTFGHWFLGIIKYELVRRFIAAPFRYFEPYFCDSDLVVFNSHLTSLIIDCPP